MAYEISLDEFEGPLDLLLHLVQQNQIDIYHISITQITTQYLEYLRQWQEMDMEIASDFIVMASRLLEIKSFMLLPRTEKPSDDADVLKQELIDQLLEYQIFKQISGYLKDREIAEMGTVFKEPEYLPELESEITVEIDVGQLRKTFDQLMIRYHEEDDFQAASESIVLDEYSVEDKITRLREILSERKDLPVAFSELLSDDAEKKEIVITLQAILEYYKVSSIELKQKGLFQEIMIYNQ